MKKQLPIVSATLEKIVGGGQTLATTDDGRKLFVWGGLPGESVNVQLTKSKSKYAEGIVAEVITSVDQRETPRDPESYLSTSPWQIMPFTLEQSSKSALITEAFALHHLELPGAVDVYTDGVEYGYRNKVEFSFWWDKEKETLDLAFFRRGTHGKIAVDGTALAHPAINAAGHAVRDLMVELGVGGLDLKTLLIRCDAKGQVSAQLYVKNDRLPLPSDEQVSALGLQGFEIILSNPKSPSSVITKRLQSWGDTSLRDTLMDVEFRYPTESFFQINLPVYEQALRDMQQHIPPNTPVVDLYSGVGTIGLTIGGSDVTLVEINEAAVYEMEQNIAALGRTKTATAVLAPSERALEYITSESLIIVDPPRAGLHQDVVDRLIEQLPAKIIYLSCNPSTQARDVQLLAGHYKVTANRGYNFFPRTPHIEHLVVLERI